MLRLDENHFVHYIAFKAAFAAYYSVGHLTLSILSC